MENPGLKAFSEMSSPEGMEVSPSVRVEEPQYIKVSYRRTSAGPQQLVQPRSMGFDPPDNPVIPLDQTRRDNLQTAPPATGVPTPPPASAANGAPAMASPAADAARITRQKIDGTKENPAYDRAQNGPGGVEDKVWARRSASLDHPLHRSAMANDWGVASGTPGRFEFQDPEPDAKRFNSHVQRLGDGRYGWMSRETAPAGRIFARGVTDNMLDAMGRAEQSHGLMKSHPDFGPKPSGYRGKRRRVATWDMLDDRPEGLDLKDYYRQHGLDVSHDEKNNLAHLRLPETEEVDSPRNPSNRGLISVQPDYYIPHDVDDTADPHHNPGEEKAIGSMFDPDSEPCSDCWVHDDFLNGRLGHDDHTESDHKWKGFGDSGGVSRFGHHEPTEDIHDLMDVQGSDGNWDYDPYMHGMFNGMELIRSIHDRDKPEFREAPEKYLEDSLKPIPKDAEWAQPQPGKTAGRHSAPEETDSEWWSHQPDVADFSDSGSGDVNSSAYEHEPACETCYLKYGTGWQGRAGHDRMVAGDHEFKPFPKPTRFSATWTPAKPGDTPGELEPWAHPLHKRAAEDDYVHWPGDEGDAYSSVPADDEWGQHGLEEHDRPQGVQIHEHEKLVNHGFRYDLDARHPSYHRVIPRDLPGGGWASENHVIERNPRVERGDIDQGTGGRNSIAFPWSHSYTQAGDTDDDTVHRGHNSFSGALRASNALSIKGPEHSEGKKALEGYSKW